jgi:hypothetical protein
VDIIFTYHSNKAEADSLISEVEGMGQKAAATARHQLSGGAPA